MVLTDTLTASLEDYLEAIYHIIAEKQAARPKDIARRLKVSNASVTGALRSLADKALINYAPYDLVTLTPIGTDVAKDVVRRHEVLRDFFVKVLSVDEQDADEAACRMEHSIPRVILERLIAFAEFVQVCPRGGAKWIAGFGYHCDRENNLENCEMCVATIQDELHSLRRKGGEKAMAVSTLRDLKPGQKGKVLKVRTKGETNKRIVEMGVTTGSLVEVERIAPLGDPIEVKVKGYHLSLRKDEAAAIDVEKL
jgi:DtxR family Mn-dependent transcriptional regulator